jgi:hypothetical protein
MNWGVKKSLEPPLLVKIHVKIALFLSAMSNPRVIRHMWWMICWNVSKKTSINYLLYFDNKLVYKVHFSLNLDIYVAITWPYLFVVLVSKISIWHHWLYCILLSSGNTAIKPECNDHPQDPKSVAIVHG